MPQLIQVPFQRRLGFGGSSIVLKFGDLFRLGLLTGKGVN